MVAFYFVYLYIYEDSLFKQCISNEGSIHIATSCVEFCLFIMNAFFCFLELFDALDE